MSQVTPQQMEDAAERLAEIIVDRFHSAWDDAPIDARCECWAPVMLGPYEPRINVQILLRSHGAPSEFTVFLNGQKYARIKTSAATLFTDFRLLAPSFAQLAAQGWPHGWPDEEGAVAP